MKSSDFKVVKLSLHSLIIFGDILSDRKVAKFTDLLEVLSEPEGDIEAIYSAYFRFYREILGVNWKEHLLELIIVSENKLNLLITSPADLKERLLEDARRDLEIIQIIAELKPQDIKRYAITCIPKETGAGAGEQEMFLTGLSPNRWPEWKNNILTQDSPFENFELKSAVTWLKQKKKWLIGEFQNNSWIDNLDSLLKYQAEVGYGHYSQHVAFRVSVDGELEGIETPDPVTVNNLICQEREQSVVIRNTEFFLSGLRANNIILYGNRGTGKSSLVKALLNEYASIGLRLIELKKSHIELLPKIAGMLAKLPMKYIVFIDDLSFDEAEEGYKNLKSLLEGGVEVRPDNVLIYATSNRKNLITETFTERKNDYVHAQDNIEEKLSLADRFGITVTFLSPDQETYLRIVEGLAEQHCIDLDREVLREKAKKWTMLHNSRSGRTARQFIDYLLGEIKFSTK